MDEKKRRLFHTDKLSGSVYYQQNWTTDPSLGIETKAVTPPVTSVETTQSRGHGWPNGRSASTDVGGNFTTMKVKSVTNNTPGTFRGVTRFGNTYIGPAWPVNPFEAVTALNEVVPADQNRMLVLGTTAIARCLPTNPVADGGVFLGELREGLPKVIGKELFKSKFMKPRKTASEYLNVEFGWKPIISDLKKFAISAIKSEKIIRQMYRDSGKPIHRKYSFPDEVTNTNSVYTNQYCWLPGGFVLSTNQYDGPGTLTIDTVKVVKTKFSGCFTYHLNLGNSELDRIERDASEARKLTGIELTPEVLWNIAPWSWLVDWEANFGDVLHNVSRFTNDGLVMQYGYIMQEVILTRTYTLHHGSPLVAGQNNGDLSATFVFNSKNRYRATPFGFGFDMSALTERQSAILGALGISRGPRHL